MEQNTTRRERIIDLLKGICILLVCLTHFAWKSAERNTFLFPWWVDMAVPVFMILSGYVYGRACAGKGIATLSQAYDPEILWSKMVRFTVPVLLTYIATLFWDLHQQGDIPYRILNTFLQGGKGPGAYYYPVMIQTTFALPVINKVIMRLEEKGLLLCLLANIAYEVLHVAYLIPAESYRLLMFRYIFVLAAGCYLAKDKPLKPLYLIMMFCIGVSFNCIYQYGGYDPLYIIHWTGTSVIASMYIIPIVWIAIRKCKCRFAPLEYIGRASYNIFLAQMLYYQCFSPIVYQAIEDRKIQLLVSMLISVCLGVLFYLVETPLTKWLQRKTHTLLFGRTKTP